MRFYLLLFLFSCGVTTWAQATDAHPVDGARLYLASRPVVLFGPEGKAGELPRQTVVEAAPAEQPGRLEVRHQERTYQADAAAFVAEERLLQDLARLDREVTDRYQEVSSAYNQHSQQLAALEEESARWAASSRTVRVVFPAPSGAERGRSPDLIVATDDFDPRRASACRHELRKLARKLEKVEQQLAVLEMERARRAEMRAAVTRLFADYRVAVRQP